MKSCSFNVFFAFLFPMIGSMASTDSMLCWRKAKNARRKIYCLEKSWRGTAQESWTRTEAKRPIIFTPKIFLCFLEGRAKIEESLFKNSFGETEGDREQKTSKRKKFCRIKYFRPLEKKCLWNFQPKRITGNTTRRRWYHHGNLDSCNSCKYYNCYYYGLARESCGPWRGEKFCYSVDRKRILCTCAAKASR